MQGARRRGFPRKTWKMTILGGSENKKGFERSEEIGC